MNFTKSIRPDAVHLAGEIRAYIAKRKLRHGDSLPTHRKLCEYFGVGGRRLREGLSILRQEGWIETRRRGGTIVTQPSLESIEAPLKSQLDHHGCTFEDMVRARAAVESAMVAEAARHRTHRDLLALWSHIEVMENPDLPFEESNRDDEKFHLALLEATHNPALRIFGRVVSDQFHSKHERKTLTFTHPLIQKSNADHRALFHALKNRRSETARKRMRAHILRQLKIPRQ